MLLVRTVWLAIVLVPVFCCACAKPLGVKTIGYPAYPDEARVDGIQGKVEVQIGIGVDGKVIFANGWGGPPVLIRAAEANVRQWTFGPFPPKSEFPMYHYVTYIFRLEGHPTEVAPQPPDIKTDLPNRIEIIANPVHPAQYYVVP